MNSDIQRTYGLVHAIASCMNCDWRSENRRTARTAAARHTRATGHKTTGEVGHAFSYTRSPAREPGK